MKKLLALVLALVMTLSLCVVSSNAAFDGENIDYKEAVEVMAKLGILVGDENGKFNPNDTLTREQAAKIICCMLLGVKTANKLSVDKAPFADVAADRWSAPFIAYCAANGVVDGLGDGSFDPAGKLTGHAFGKMLLTALGVDGAFTGSSWAINVAAALVEEKLDVNVEDVVLSQNLTREQAAQFALNGLKWNGSETTYGVYDKTEKMMYTFDNRTDALLFYSLDKANRTYNPEYKDAEDSLIDEVFGVTVSTGADTFGRVATVYSHKDWDDLKFGEKADYVLVAQKDQTLAKLLEDNNLDKKLTTLNGKAIAGDVKAGEVVELFTEKKDIENVVPYFYAYAKVADLEKVDAESSDLDEDRAEAGISKVYDLTTDAKVDEAKYLFVDKLTDDEYSEKNVEIVELGDLAKKDTVALTLQAGEKAEYLVRGVAALTFVDGVKTASGTSYIKVDGTKYVLSSMVSKLDVGNYADTWTYALDPNGIVVHGEEKEVSDEDLNYAWVNSVDATDEDSALLGTAEDAAAVQLVGLDGEKTTYNYNLKKAPKDATAESKTYLDKDNKGVKLDKGDLYFEYEGVKYAFTAANFKAVVKADKWVSFTEADGAVTLKAANADADAAKLVKVTAVEDTKALAKDLYATSSTTVTVLKAGKVVKSYAGYANFPKANTIKDKDALVLLASNSTYAKSVYIFDKNAVADKETIDVALFVSTGDTTEDGVVATFYIDGQKVDYTVAAKDVEGAKAGQLFAAEVDEDGELTLGASVGTKDVVTDADGEYVILKTAGALDLDEDCAVYKVSKDGKTVTTMSVEDLEKDQAVMFILNGDEDAVAYIFIYKDITILEKK